MIDATRLKDELQVQVAALEADMGTWLEQEPSFAEPLKERYQTAFKSKRTAATFNTWAEQEITQAAVAWVLATVFIRFLEDNGLIPDPILSGPPERLRLAQDALSHHFLQHPGHAERDYVLHHFTALRQYPALSELLGPHNALHKLHPSSDALKGLIAFWRQIDPASGDIRHDFRDAELSTRFLGDLYQYLSESARKTYALLQTPDFIEEFILDRTLTPALREFGLKTVRMIDPTCGSGHFLLGAFRRLFALWVKEVPTTREAAVKALAAVHGVDLNPFAVAISRFRLIIEACHACGITRLADAPDFEIHVATGDALLHGRRFRKLESDVGAQRAFDTEEIFRDELKHHYDVEDIDALHRILGQQYHAVVGNPPYIAVEDKAIRAAYKMRYESCHGRWVLTVPFMERFFELAIKGDCNQHQPAGFIGQITGNNFMKREFGKKLVEQFFPKWDITHIIDTDKAHIPGHATGTIILFGRNQPPCGSTIRAVMGIKKQEPTPEVSKFGLVWLAILEQTDIPGSQSEWISVAEAPRENFHRHPWSIGGGGAAELKEQIEICCDDSVAQWVSEIGISAVTGEDDLYIFPNRTDLLRSRIENTKTIVTGDLVRDWQMDILPESVWLYDESFRLLSLTIMPQTARLLWPYRSSISRRKRFGTPMIERGMTWYEWQELYKAKLETPLTITWGEVTTHNHFILDRGGKVFKNTAPVMKLKAGKHESDHLRLLGALNSAATCFWLRQVCHDKGGGGIGGGIASEAWEHRFAFNSTQIATLPLPSSLPQELPTAIVQTSTILQVQSPAAALASWGEPGSEDLRACLARARDAWHRQRRQLIAWQEELDWQIYEAFGLIEAVDQVSLPEGAAQDTIPPEGIQLGERAFEIVLARRRAAGEVQTTWFERHGSTPLTELPPHWPAAYRGLVERRIDRIESDPNIRLIEQPEYKRRWNTEPWDVQLKKACEAWLLARLETYACDSERMDGAEATAALRASWTAGQSPTLFTLAQLVAVAETDAALKEVMEVYTGTAAFDLNRQVKDLLEEASVPYLPIQRYRESGLRKRRDWERVWDLQRREDAIETEIMARLEPEAQKLADAVLAKQADASAEERQQVLERARQRIEAELQREVKERQAQEIGPVPVPPKYVAADFRRPACWKLRDKLDVPKERWVFYPGLETPAAPSPLYAWAGWNSLQQAQALSALYVQRKQGDGWATAQLTPILAGLLELVPWLQQWHNEFNEDYGMKLGDHFAEFVADECRELGLTMTELDRARWG
jgi:hypothetical protein